MLIIQGPYPALQTTVVLPSAQLGNQVNMSGTVQTLRSMNGTLYTYVIERRARRVFQWDILSTEQKSNEIKDFVRRYAGNKVKLTDHNETAYIGYITINPFESMGAGGGRGGEYYQFTIQLSESA